MQVGGRGGCWQVAPDVDPAKAITLASMCVSLWSRYAYQGIVIGMRDVTYQSIHIVMGYVSAW